MKIVTKVIGSLMLVFVIMGLTYAINDKEFSITNIIDQISKVQFDNPIDEFTEAYNEMLFTFDDVKEASESITNLETFFKAVGLFFNVVFNGIIKTIKGVYNFIRIITKDIFTSFQFIRIIFGF